MTIIFEVLSPLNFVFAKFAKTEKERLKELHCILLAVIYLYPNELVEQFLNLEYLYRRRKRWKKFRQALDKQDRKIFDNMFPVTHLYNSACFYAANPVRIRPIFMSIIFHRYKQLLKLE
jgi:hypothetical protein